MPYAAGSRLPGERASKLGHLDVINSELVSSIIAQFESPEPAEYVSNANWQPYSKAGDPLRIIFAVDGSKQTIQSELPPYKTLSFVKTALLRLDQRAIDELDPLAPHPLHIKKIMSDSAVYHATVLPLKGIRMADMTNGQAIRRIIYDSFRDASIQAMAYETLKWLAYEKWTDDRSRSSPGFECPECGTLLSGLPYDSDEGKCTESTCRADLYLTDMIGFHLELGEESAPDSLSTSYMLVHETLMLFSGIRYFWEKRMLKILSDSLFLKDGPLTMRAQYSKLVIPIRNFIEFAAREGVIIHLAGQEKTGAFKDHLDLIVREASDSSIFAPDNDYIRREIQNTGGNKEPYGKRTNYGNKLFVKSDNYHSMVLSVPVGQYADTRSTDQFIGLDRILVTLERIKSFKHEGALVPIELANGVASLSSYPSATILKMFADV